MDSAKMPHHGGDLGMVTVLQPSGWAQPSGYANGLIARGVMLFVAGQIGWNPSTSAFETDDFAAQVRQALGNVVAVLREGGAIPEHVARMTWFITDRRAYLDARHEIGLIYREIFGRHFPAMSVVIVAALLEERAKVEIEVTAVIPD